MVVEVVAMTHLTFSNPSLVAARLVVSLRAFILILQFLCKFYIVLSHSNIPVSSGGGSSRGRRQRRGEDVIHPLKVSLEDLCNGTSKKLSLSRNVICSKCKG